MAQHIIVTGANRGIGLEFVRQLAGAGHQVTATARTPERASALQKLAAQHGAVEIAQLDIAEMASVEAFKSRLGDRQVDALINNAGIYPDAGDFGQLDWAQVTRGFEVNTIAPLRLTETLLSHLGRGRGKRVMFVTSQMGSIDDNRSGGAYAYRMSKTALNMGVRSLARDLASCGVVSFVIHPGWVKTDMGGEGAKLTPEQSVEGMLAVLWDADAQTAGEFMNWDGSKLPW